jgi:hypothetical protein
MSKLVAQLAFATAHPVAVLVLQLKVAASGACGVDVSIRYILRYLLLIYEVAGDMLALPRLLQVAVLVWSALFRVRMRIYVEKAGAKTRGM